jgi:hypothetical protein
MGVVSACSHWLRSPFAAAEETSRNLIRRVRPGDPEWPNQQAWDELARRVDGRLVSAELPYQVCIDQPQSSACASRLPESLFQKDQIAALAQAVLDGSQHHRCEFHFNKGLAGAPEEVRRTLRETTAIPVAASEAFCLLQIASNMANVRPGVKGHDPDPAVLRQRADAVNRAYAPFRALVSEPRTYQAQMSYHEPNWQQVCWGEHYERLLNIKRRYDPENLFFAHHCVGSENWSPDGFEQLS